MTYVEYLSFVCTRPIDKPIRINVRYAAKDGKHNLGNRLRHRRGFCQGGSSYVYLLIK